MPWFSTIIRELLDDARKWSAGRSWLVRLPMLIWFARIAWGHWSSPEYESFLGGINLGIHEFGHLICSPFGQFVTVAGGSFVQCLVPVISIFMFRRQEDYFAFAFSSLWLGTNLHGVSRYIGDARKLQLDLVSPFGGDGEVIHDWNFLLNRMGLLHFEVEIAAVVRVTSYLFLLAGVLWGGWILWQMLRQKKSESDDWGVPSN